VPVPPAELSAEFTIDPAGGEAVRAGRQVAIESGLAIDAGSDATALSGARHEVLDALHRVLDAALDAGAATVEVTLRVPRAVRKRV
jgi:uncharacterized protein YqgV (UPF0045/DUF77 family)